MEREPRIEVHANDAGTQIYATALLFRECDSTLCIHVSKPKRTWPWPNDTVESARHHAKDAAVTETERFLSEVRTALDNRTRPKNGEEARRRLGRLGELLDAWKRAESEGNDADLGPMWVFEQALAILRGEGEWGEELQAPRLQPLRLQTPGAYEEEGKDREAMTRQYDRYDVEGNCEIDGVQEEEYRYQCASYQAGEEGVCIYYQCPATSVCSCMLGEEDL